MTTKSNIINMLAVGDNLVNRDDPESPLSNVALALEQGDVVFAQIDCSYSERGRRADNLGWRGFREHTHNVPAIAHTGIKKETHILS